MKARNSTKPIAKTSTFRPKSYRVLRGLRYEDESRILKILRWPGKHRYEGVTVVLENKAEPLNNTQFGISWDGMIALRKLLHKAQVHNGGNERWREPVAQSWAMVTEEKERMALDFGLVERVENTEEKT